MVSPFLTDKMCVPENSAASQSFYSPESARSATGALFVQALFFKRKVQIRLRSDLNLKFKRLEIHIIFLIPFFIKSLKKVSSESYCVSRPLQLCFHQAVFPLVNINGPSYSIVLDLKRILILPKFVVNINDPSFATKHSYVHRFADCYAYYEV